MTIRLKPTTLDTMVQDKLLFLKRIAIIFYILSQIVFVYIIYFFITGNTLMLSKIAIVTFISWILKLVLSRERPLEYYEISVPCVGRGSLISAHTTVALYIFFENYNNPLFYPLLIVPICRVLGFCHWISDIIISAILAYVFSIIF